jgi:hypothetical protein
MESFREVAARAGDWKAVRAFDASDLEQWLEQSIPAQVWLAEQLALPVNGHESWSGCGTGGRQRPPSDSRNFRTVDRRSS